MDPLNSFLISLAFLTGCCLGSFGNVMALRQLQDESFVMPPSHCPQCKTTLRPIDNIPVLSYLFLGGQCHHCKTPISIQYPLVELLMGVIFALTVFVFGLQWTTLLVLFAMFHLVVILVTDWRESLIFENNSLPLLPAGALFAWFGPFNHSLPLAMRSLHLNVGGFVIPDMFISGVLGLLIAIGFFEGMILLSKKAFGTEGFGHGDTHLMMGAGLFLGWQGTIAALVIGFIVQSVMAIPLLMLEWIKQRDYVAVGSASTSFVFAAFPIFMMNLRLDAVMLNVITIASVLLTLVALFIFLKRVRETEHYTYMPLGPALILGCWIVLFGQMLYPNWLSGLKLGL